MYSFHNQQNEVARGILGQYWPGRGMLAVGRWPDG